MGISATVRVGFREMVGKGVQDHPPKLEQIGRVVCLQRTKTMFE